MSDTSQGPGWWQASDGKWYRPESHPDYVPPAPPPPPPPPLVASTPIPSVVTPEASGRKKKPAKAAAKRPAKKLNRKGWGCLHLDHHLHLDRCNHRRGRRQCWHLLQGFVPGRWDHSGQSSGGKGVHHGCEHRQEFRHAHLYDQPQFTWWRVHGVRRADPSRSDPGGEARVLHRHDHGDEPRSQVRDRWCLNCDL